MARQPSAPLPGSERRAEIALIFETSRHGDGTSHFKEISGMLQNQAVEQMRINPNPYIEPPERPGTSPHMTRSRSNGSASTQTALQRSPSQGSPVLGRDPRAALQRSQSNTLPARDQGIAWQRSHSRGSSLSPRIGHSQKQGARQRAESSSPERGADVRAESKRSTIGVAGERYDSKSSLMGNRYNSKSSRRSLPFDRRLTGSKSQPGSPNWSKSQPGSVSWSKSLPSSPSWSKGQLRRSGPLPPGKDLRPALQRSQTWTLPGRDRGSMMQRSPSPGGRSSMLTMSGVTQERRSLPPQIVMGRASLLSLKGQLPSVSQTKAMSFEDIFKKCKRSATKRMSVERGERLLKEGFGSPRRLQFRSLHNWHSKTVPLAADDDNEEQEEKQESGADMERMETGQSSQSRVSEAPEAKPVVVPVVHQTEDEELKKMMDGRESDCEGDDELEEILRLPNKAETLARLRDESGEEFPHKEIQRMQACFLQYQYEGSPEVHKDDLKLILQYLGYLKMDTDAVEDLVSKLTRYTTLNFDEYLQFMKMARDYERVQVKKTFEQFDDDGSGELSAHELEGLLKSIGITPFRSTIAGALAVVDEDGSGSLDFEEFIQLLAIYRTTEGFARQEVIKLYRIYSRYADTETNGDETVKSLKPDKMKDALINMFGNQAQKVATQLGDEVTKPSRQATYDGRPLERDGMSFREFLIWARKLREAEIELYAFEFNKADEDGGGQLDHEEIKLVLERLGYTPLRTVVMDLVDTFDTDRGGTLDFDEFVNMMELFRRSDGFTRQEVKDMSEIFKLYGKGGEVDVVQVAAMLRSLGFHTEHEKSEAMVKTVDWNGSNSLDFGEFLRLMRLHREDELTGIKDAFDNVVGEKDFLSNANEVKTVLRNLGYDEKVVRPIIGVVRSLLNDDHIDFDSLVGISDNCRRQVMYKMRKQAGYDDDKIEWFRKQFQELDFDNSGVLNRKKLTAFCTSRGLSLATKEDQKFLIRVIDDARVSARSSGVPAEDCGPDGSKEVSFWHFIHMQRVLQTHEDKKNARKAETQEHNFSKSEVKELKSVFELRVHREHDLGGGSKDKLSVTGLWIVLESLGVSLKPMEREQIQNRMFLDLGVTAGAGLAFEAFLKLIAWMISSNVGGALQS
eukprot:TRINITY_DN30013_c0_g1_i2.p1 TRINITY_DN30013_c0_g1~~TRINITY_DN30013_c0_g1_i2.p1  ORF type:complete len:1134 (-),score=236.17 TRINITY_DN30013_c0_g1_i2:257-3658(-)